MINIKDLKVQGNESSNENDLSLINNNLLSDTKVNLKTRNEAINSLSDNNIKKFFQSNYSFSDKTIGNELSKINFESIEEELITTLYYENDWIENDTQRNILQTLIYSKYEVLEMAKLQNNMGYKQGENTKQNSRKRHKEEEIDSIMLKTYV